MGEALSRHATESSSRRAGVGNDFGSGPLEYYSSHMTPIERTEEFAAWESRLKKKDLRAAARVTVRIQRLSLGNPGDVRPVGEGVSELRISYGPGYRVYYTTESDLLILLLTGGAKPTQQADILEAKRLARIWREERT